MTAILATLMVVELLPTNTDEHRSFRAQIYGVLWGYTGMLTSIVFLYAGLHKDRIQRLIGATTTEQNVAGASPSPAAPLSTNIGGSTTGGSAAAGGSVGAAAGP